MKNSTTPFVQVVSIGDELLQSGRLNTTAPHLTQELSRLGYKSSIHTISDELNSLIDFIKKNLKTPTIYCGGLGPTKDDNTVLAVSKALNTPLIYQKKHLAFLKKIQKARGLDDAFLKQALYPQGFQCEKSLWGTAPFLYLNSPSKTLFLLPGVPQETLNLFHKKVLPLLIKKYPPKKFFIKEMKILDLPESLVEARINTLEESSQKEITVAYLPSGGELTVQLKGEEEKPLLTLRAKIKKLFPEQVVYLSGEAMSSKLHLFFKREKLKIGFVESLTGGMLSSLFTQYPDSSSYFDSSLVAYSNQAKEKIAFLKPSLIEKYGVVSKEAVVALAKNHLVKRKLDFVLATSGVAGPSSVKENTLKKVGLVYLGMAFRKNQKIIVNYKKLLLTGSREQIRAKTLKKACILMAELFLK